MKVRVKSAITKTAPGFIYSNLWNTGISYQANEIVEISLAYFPGQAFPHGTYEDWVFWTNSDVDYGIIFLGGEINQLILTQQDSQKLKDAPLESAPFEVIFLPD